MTLRWIEGFETFTENTSVDVQTSMLRKYVSAGSFTSSDGRITGLSAGNDTIDVGFLSPIFNLEETWIFGFGYRNNTSFSDDDYLIGFNSNSTNILQLRTVSTGELEIWRPGGINGTVLAQSSITLSLNTWHYIEVKIRFHNTLGSYHLKIDGVDAIPLTTGADTTTLTSNGANVFEIRNANLGFLDDLYICDNTGSVNNDFLGDSAVKLFKPIANGSQNDWTSTSGTNYDDINEIPADDDTTVISSSTPGDIDLYGIQRVGGAFDLSDVYGMQLNATIKKTDVGSRTMKTVIKSDVSGTPTTEEGKEQGIADNYVVYSEVSETDPDTGTAWDRSSITNAEFGIKLEQ